MTRFLAALPLAFVCFTAPALADELIRHANDQESLVLGLSRLSNDLQSVDKARAPVQNKLSGGQIELGYANTRMRTLFGLRNIYTRVQICLGLGQQDFDGKVFDPSTGKAGTSNGPFFVETESMRARVGYTWEFGGGGPLAVTPFLGLSQQGWLRGDTTYSGTTAYHHFAANVGLLGQMSVTPQIVFGAEASLGRILRAWQVDQRDLISPQSGLSSSLALYLDNRTSSDWHQRFIVRQSVQRYGEPAQSVGSFEPRRDTAISFELEFGTELDLFESLFH